MLGGVHAAGDAERFLRGRDGSVVNPGGAEDVEAGAEARAGECGEAGGARPAVQVQAERGGEGPQSPEGRGQHTEDIRVAGEDSGEAIFGDDGEFQVGTGLFEEMECRGGEDAVAQGAETNYGNMAAWGEPVEGVRQPGHRLMRRPKAYATERAASHRCGLRR